MADVTLEEIKLQRLPSIVRDGNQQGMHECEWWLTASEPIPSDYALAIAQGLSPGAPSGAQLIPQQDNVLAVDNGEIYPGLTQLTIAAWVLAGENRYGDGGALAKIFRCIPRESGPTKHHACTVTFKAPQGANFLDDRRWLSRFQLGNFPKRPTVSNPNKTQVISALNNGNSPLSEPKNVRVEYITRERVQKVWLPVTKDAGGNLIVSPGAFPQPIISTNGEPMPALIGTERIQQVTITMPVEDRAFALLLNNLYLDTINTAAFTWDGETVPAYHAKYDVAEVSDPIDYDGGSYRILSYRVEIANRPYFEEIPATGSYYLVDLPGPVNEGESPLVGREGLRDNEGFPIPGVEYSLNVNGRLSREFIKANDPVSETDALRQHILYGCKYKLQDYSDLLEAGGD